MKGKILVLILLVIFASFTTLAFVNSNAQATKENVGFDGSYQSESVMVPFVEPTGIPIDTPGGPT